MPLKEEANLERISVGLPPAAWESISAAVKAGEFPSSAELIRTAVREFFERRKERGLIAQKPEAACPAV